MQALFLGSISVLADTSDLQRRCFNTAFEEAELDWHWSVETYRKMLRSSGGRDRVSAYAALQGHEVDAHQIHAYKSALFHDVLRQGRLPMRPGTKALLDEAHSHDLPIAFVSGTDPASLDALLDGLGGAKALGIDLVTSSALGLSPKPSPALYLHALNSLGLAPSDVLVIEDNRAGVDAAKAAGLRCLVYPNSNTTEDDFPDVEGLAIGRATLAA